VRRVWAAVAATWALFAIVAFLAWAHPPVQPVGGGASQVVMIKGKGGKAHAVLLPGGVAAHTTTHSSPVR
jgi:hypothetical protein